MKERYLEGKAGKLHFVSYSDTTTNKPLLLFLHGMTCHAHYWDEIAPAFADDLAVYALDFRGHGDSFHVKAAEGDIFYTFAGYVQDVAGWISQLNPQGQTVTLVGHSLGGYVALLYASRNPAGLSKIVACDVKSNSTPAEHEGGKRAGAKPQPAFNSIEEVAARLKATMPDGSASEVTLLNIARYGSVQNADGTYSLKYDRKLLDFEPIEPFKFVNLVEKATLVVNGERSPIMNREQARALAQAMPNAKAVEVANAGHHIFLDNPAEFVKVLKGYILES
jgi:esterase